MTVKEKMITILVSNGLFESQANDILEIYISEMNKTEDYQITWESDSEALPSIIYNLLFVKIKPFALKWIDKNKPQHWAREMFV